MTSPLAAVATPPDTMATTTTASGRIRRGRRRLPTIVFSVTVIVVWVVAAIGWRWLAPSSPTAQDATKFQPPSLDHLFGTDGFGRDVFSRVLAGAELVLTVAPLAVALATVSGVLLGLSTGYLGGRFDGASMRVLEAIAVVPALFPAILVVALLGNSDPVLVLVLAFAFAPIVARTVRASTLVEREKQYVEAARLRSEHSAYVMGREILPNITGPIAVEATGRLADAVFLIATLAFVGLGAEAGSPDWGAQVAENRVNIQFAWWTVVFPALAVASLVIAVSLLADALRERRVVT